MKKTYLRPEFEISVFESKNEISARGDWELNISRGDLDSNEDVNKIENRAHRKGRP